MTIPITSSAQRLPAGPSGLRRSCRLPGALAERGDYYRRRLAEILGADRVGDYVVPTQLVEDRAELDLGGRVLDLQAHGAAHTDNDLTVLDRQTGTLWAGDLLFVGRIPAIDGSLTGWLKALDGLKALPATRAVPGHGPPVVAWPEAAADEARYFDTLRRRSGRSSQRRRYRDRHRDGRPGRARQVAVVRRLQWSERDGRVQGTRMGLGRKETLMRRIA